MPWAWGGVTPLFDSCDQKRQVRLDDGHLVPGRAPEQTVSVTIAVSARACVNSRYDEACRNS